MTVVSCIIGAVSSTERVQGIRLYCFVLYYITYGTIQNCSIQDSTMYCILLFVTVLCSLYCSVPGEVGSTEIRLYYKVLNCMVLYFTWRDE